MCGGTKASEHLETLRKCIDPNILTHIMQSTKLDLHLDLKSNKQIRSASSGECISDSNN